MTMAWFRNRCLAGGISVASSLLVGCSGSEPQQQTLVSSASSPAPQSANRPQSQQPLGSSSPQPSPAAKPAASSQPSPVTQKLSPPPSPAVKLSTSDKKLISKVQKEVQEKGAVAKQDVGQTYLGNVLRSQQAVKLVDGRFTSDLHALQTDLPGKMSDYQLQILAATEQKAVVVAIAKQTGIPSYTGAVYAQEASIPVSTICKSNEPTKTPPGAPKLMGSKIVCAQGSTAIAE